MAIRVGSRAGPIFSALFKEFFESYLNFNWPFAMAVLRHTEKPRAYFQSLTGIRTQNRSFHATVGSTRLNRVTPVDGRKVYM